MADNTRKKISRLQENLNKLDSIMEFDTIPDTIVDLVKKIIGTMNHQPEISLTNHKNVLLVFHKSNGDFLTIEFTNDYKILLAKNTYQETINNKQIEYNDILTEVNLFI